MKRRVAILTLALAACGGDDAAEQTPTEAPAQEAEEEPTEAPLAEVPPTEVPATEVPPTAEPVAEEVPTEEATETGSPLATMDHVPDPNLVNITWEWERRDPNGNEVPEIIVPTRRKV